MTTNHKPARTRVRLLNAQEVIDLVALLQMTQPAPGADRDDPNPYYELGPDSYEALTDPE